MIPIIAPDFIPELREKHTLCTGEIVYRDFKFDESLDDYGCHEEAFFPKEHTLSFVEGLNVLAIDIYDKIYTGVLIVDELYDDYYEEVRTVYFIGDNDRVLYPASFVYITDIK